MDNRERKNIAPCGKCGGTGTLKVCIEQRKKKFYVHCINCGYISERKDTIDEAKAEWNKQGAYANEEYPDCAIELTDHVMTKWKVVKKSTIFEKGLKTATCKYCKRKFEYSTAKLQATISMPTAKKIKVGQKIKMQVKLTSGDYISAFSVTKDGKTTVAKVTKGPNYVWIKGLKKGNAVLKVRTKAGKTASCKLEIYK